MRPIVWGFILTIVGCFFWIIFSVIYGVGLGFGAPENPMLTSLVYLFGALFFFSLPIAIILEIVRWIRHRSFKPEIRVNPPE